MLRHGKLFRRNLGTALETTNRTKWPHHRAITQVRDSATMRVYAPSSPWNTPVPASPTIHSNSANMIAYLTATSANTLGYWTSDPTQFAFPTYRVNAPVIGTRTVTYSGVFADVSAAMVGTFVKGGGTVQFPIPAGAVASPGSDASMIVKDIATGDLYGGWQFATADSGATWSCVNCYVLRAAFLNTGLQPYGFPNRGPGMGFEAGTVMLWELLQGHIDHALGFANNAANGFWIPDIATKSDGANFNPDFANSAAFPEGTWIQLDPSISDATIRSWAFTGQDPGVLLTICHALQYYGARHVDNSGQRPGKFLFEGQETALWGTGGRPSVTIDTMRNVPVSAFRVLAHPVPATNGQPADTNVGTVVFRDLFPWTVTGGWIRSEIGGDWSVGSASQFSESGGKAAINLAAANTSMTANALNATPVLNSSLVIVYELTVGAPTAGQYYIEPFLRMDANQRGRYTVRVRHWTDNTIRAQFGVYTDNGAGGSTGVYIASDQSAGEYTIAGLTAGAAGTQYTLKFEVSGTSPTQLRLKVWKVGTSEPGTFQMTVNESTAALQAAGVHAVKVGTTSTGAPTPVQVKLDSFVVTAV